MRLGDMLVAAKIVTAEQVEEALASQKESGRRLGAELVARGIVSELQITQMLSNQLSVPWVDLQHVEFSRELLSLLPREIADEHCCIPVYKREVRKEGDTVFVAMDDPSNEHALAAIREACALPVKAMVSPPFDIRNAIRVYYFGESPLPRPKPADGSIPAPPLEPEAAPQAEAVPRAEDAAASAEEAKPAEPEPAKGPRFVTLTLLDGTTVRLPSPAGQGAPAAREPEADTLTASDLVNALLARGQGKAVGDILGEDANWEVLFATLLQLLIRKGIVADWEFVEAWKKSRR